jgi:hypothetical protein
VVVLLAVPVKEGPDPRPGIFKGTKCQQSRKTE